MGRISIRGYAIARRNPAPRSRPSRHRLRSPLLQVGALGFHRLEEVASLRSEPCSIGRRLACAADAPRPRERTFRANMFEHRYPVCSDASFFQMPWTANISASDISATFTPMLVDLPLSATMPSTSVITRSRVFTYARICGSPLSVTPNIIAFSINTVHLLRLV